MQEGNCTIAPPGDLRDAIDGLKFSSCLPEALAVKMLQRRMEDPVAVEHVLSRPIRLVSLR